jgi:hypothetical protein
MNVVVVGSMLMLDDAMRVMVWSFQGCVRVYAMKEVMLGSREGRDLVWCLSSRKS